MTDLLILTIWQGTGLFVLGLSYGVIMTWLFYKIEEKNKALKRRDAFFKKVAEKLEIDY